MLAPLIHILPLTTLLRTRLLPEEGRLLVNVGQKVNPTDIVAEAVVGKKHLVVDLAQKLGVSQSQVARMLKVKKGQQVSKDEVLAESPGLFGREATSPTDGLVVAIGSGKIVLETGGAIFELAAGLPGVVVQLIGTRGVVIRATGAIIQGLWGNGRLDFGQLHSLMDAPDEVLDPGRIEVSLRGSILLGGHVESPKVFHNAAELPVRGLLIASLAPALLPLALQAAYPVVVLEGFGRRPINSSTYKLLSTNVKREISLNAEFADRQKDLHPEAFIPLPVSQEPPGPSQADTFTAGQMVRVISLSKPARLGTLTRLCGISTLPSGIIASAAEVRLESGEEILTPLTNLEVLG
jgi:hypothetical protein